MPLYGSGRNNWNRIPARRLQAIPVPTVNIWDENDPEAVEYTDLSQIWHKASEEPKSEDELTVVLIVDFFGNFWVCNIYNTFRDPDETWEDYVTCNQVNYWVYIKDLLPKGNSFFTKLI